MPIKEQQAVPTPPRQRKEVAQENGAITAEYQWTLSTIQCCTYCIGEAPCVLDKRHRVEHACVRVAAIVVGQ
jgi:hypothetical protein